MKLLFIILLFINALPASVAICSAPPLLTDSTSSASHLKPDLKWRDLGLL